MKKIISGVALSCMLTGALSGQVFASSNTNNALQKQLIKIIKQERQNQYYRKLPKVSLNAINQPLGIVMQNFAVLTNYSLSFEDGVNLNTPVTIRLVNVPVNQAIKTILDPIGYYFTVDNTHHRIVVKAFVSKTIQIPPSIIDDESLKYSFSSTGESGQSSSGSGGGGGSSSDTSTIGGDVEATGKIDLKSRSEGKDAVKIFINHVRSMLSNSGTASLDPVTGSLYIRDYKPYVETATKYVHNWIKSFSKEVYVKAYIVDVSLNRDHEFGIDWNTIQRDLIRHSTTIGLSQASTSVISNPVGQITANNGSTVNPFNLVIKALSSQGNVRVLSEPRVVIMNHEIGYIQAGDSIPYVSNIQENYIGTTGDNAQTTYDISRVLEGVTFAIKPHILKNGKIDLTIIPTLSSVKGWQKLTIGKNVINNPIVTTRNLYSKLTVKNGQFIVIGGAQTNSEQTNKIRIPILGDIPIIGGLFGTTTHTKTKSVMLVLLKVNVVNAKVANRLHNEAVLSIKGK